MIAGRKCFQIQRLPLHGKSSFTQGFDDNIKAYLLIIESDNEDIGPPGLMIFDTVNLFQDSPYPCTGASGKTAGNRQLNDFLHRKGNIR